MDYDLDVANDMFSEKVQKEDHEYRAAV